MSLNIKSAEAHRLAQELASLTGESMSAAVTEALRERLNRLQRKGLAERLMAIGRETAPLLNGPGKTMMEVQDLYDEKTGLPK